MLSVGSRLFHRISRIHERETGMWPCGSSVMQYRKSSPGSLVSHLCLSCCGKSSLVVIKANAEADAESVCFIILWAAQSSVGPRWPPDLYGRVLSGEKSRNKWGQCVRSKRERALFSWGVNPELFQNNQLTSQDFRGLYWGFRDLFPG